MADVKDSDAGARKAAFPELSDEHVDRLRLVGEERDVEAGEILFRPGATDYGFIVILDGRIAIVDDFGTSTEREVVEHGAGGFLGEANLLIGQSPIFTAVVRETM